MKKIEVCTIVHQYSNIDELPLDEQQLLFAARDASSRSYSPYSEFKVGAAVLLENGEVITGNNQENAAYPSGLCAERTVIFWSNAQYPDKAIIKMAITAQKNGKFVDQPISPCGSCRQVMIESEKRFNTNMKTILDGKKYIYVIKKAADLLPLQFTGSKDSTV
jgi:cytidine deaminase